MGYQITLAEFNEFLYFCTSGLRVLAYSKLRLEVIESVDCLVFALDSDAMNGRALMPIRAGDMISIAQAPKMSTIVVRYHVYIQISTMGSAPAYLSLEGVAR